MTTYFEYDSFGDRSDRPLLLIMGLGAQMILFDEDICRDLAGRGHYVIRFDNRDIGLSTKFEEAGIPDLLDLIGKWMMGEKVSAPYTLDDMADDSVGLLDALGIRKAHILGTFMGGMIAQTIAIRHTSRILSLISTYSSTGNPELPQPKPEIVGLLMTPPPDEREANIEHTLGVFKAIAGPGFPFDEKWTRKIMAESYDRSFYPQGKTRQLTAIIAHGDRGPALASVKVPTLVIHGTDDPAMLVEAGKDTAKAIPGAELLLIEGMGHDLPHGGAWSQIIEAVTAFTAKVPA